MTSYQLIAINLQFLKIMLLLFQLSASPFTHTNAFRNKMISRF